jgi:hypothetical protein
MKRSALLFCTAFSFLTGDMVAAAEIGACDNIDRVSFLVGETRSFSQGKIRIAHVDTDGEPVCCSSHLLIIIPARELGSQCFALSDEAASDKSEWPRGFSNLAFAKISASYDPNRGLLLSVPYELYDLDGGKGKPGMTRVRVDLRGDGAVTIEP